MLTRRTLLAAGAALSAAPVVAGKPAVAPRMRVIIDNDLGGDPDGLFQLAHFALSPSVSIPLVVGSHYRDFGEADRVPEKGRVSADKAKELLGFLPKDRRPMVVAGENAPLRSRTEVHRTSTTELIVREAMRADLSTPLFYAAGGSLTDIAQAWLADPKIGKRLRLLWIGGGEHPDLATPPPGPAEPEYNFSLDPLAAQIVFNETDIEIWQVPRNAFRQMLFSRSEIENLGRESPLGRYLNRQVATTNARLSENLPKFIYAEGEAVGLGDSALVALTALQSAFQPDTSSSSYVIRPTPTLQADGSYKPNPTGRPMRVYAAIDASLTWRDMAAKLRQK